MQHEMQHDRPKVAVYGDLSRVRIPAGSPKKKPMQFKELHRFFSFLLMLKSVDFAQPVHTLKRAQRKLGAFSRANALLNH